MGLLGYAVEVREIALSMMSKRPANENKNVISEKSSRRTLEREKTVTLVQAKLRPRCGGCVLFDLNK